MKNGLFSVVFASAMLGATTYAFAGAYGEAEQPEEIPAPAPAAVPAPLPPPPHYMHKFVGFIEDAETTHGLWAELGSVYAMEYHPDRTFGESRSDNTYLHLSYGKDMWEVGALMPYIYNEQENLAGNNDVNDFGDLRLWGKVLPVRTDRFTFGGGLMVSFPTAGKDLGTDAYGFEPFLTVGGLAGPVSIRYHAGYYVTTHPDTSRVECDPSTFTCNTIADDTFDEFNQNLGVLYAVNDRIVVRGELTHAHLTNSDADPVSIFPGVDFSIPVGTNEIVLRPTFGIGITEAPDWQAGLGIAFNAPGI